MGCGTSYHACVLGSVYLARLAGRAAVPVLAPQFLAQYLPPLGPEDVGVFVSQSGETKDVLNALEAAKARGAGILGLVNVLGSTLMHASEAYLPLACGYEISRPRHQDLREPVRGLPRPGPARGRAATIALLKRLPALSRRPSRQWTAPCTT